MSALSSINIRQAKRSEAVVLSGMVSASFRDVAQRFNLTPQNCPKHPSNCTREWIENDFRRGVVYYFLEHNGTPAGCVALEKAFPDLFYLERLCVLPEHRRKGFGRALVGFVLAQAKNLGAERIGIGIIAEQTDLKLWYRKMGFVEKETREFSHLPFLVCFMECVP